MMIRIVVAAGVDNELSAKDISSMQRLLQAGYQVELYYYLPKVPAEFTMIPSFNKELKGWREHAKVMLSALSKKLGVNESHCHFVDEILGPDKIFEEIKNLDTQVILTSVTEEFKQSWLSKFYDKIIAFSKGNKLKKFIIKNVNDYAEQVLGKGKTAHYPGDLQFAANDPRVQLKKQTEGKER